MSVKNSPHLTISLIILTSTFKKTIMKTAYKTLLLLLCAFNFAAAQDTKIISIPNNDILYVPSEERIYVTTPSGGSRGNSLCVIDPYFGEVEVCYPIGSEPGVMALSDDEQFLYIGLRGAAQVVQFSMVSKTIVNTFSLGSDPFFGSRYAEDIEVLPGQPQSIAVSMYRQAVSPRHSGVAIVDSGVLRPNVTQDHTGSNNIVFANGALYGYNNETSEFGLRRLLINAAGVTQGSVQEGLISGFDNVIESQANRMYAKGGEVVNVAGATPFLEGTFSILNTFRAAVEPAPDSNVVYFVTHEFFNTTFRLETFDKTTFNGVSSLEIPNMEGDVKKLIHWGTGGKLAFNTPNTLVLLRSCTSNITTPIVITSPSLVACTGETVELSGPDGWERYFWSNGSTTRRIDVSETGLYSLRIPDATGCLSAPSNTLFVSFESAPPPPFLSEQGEIIRCQGEVAILTAFHSSFGASYIWSNGATTQTIQVSQAGAYTAASVSGGGCVGAASAPVTVSFRDASAPPQPIVAWTGSTAFCQGGSLELRAPTGFASYAWSNGATTPAIEVTESGDYSVQVTNAAGCASPVSSFVSVVVSPTPGQPMVFQNGAILASSAQVGNQWFLNGNPIAGATSQFYTPTANGFYSVQVTLNGCPSEVSALLNFVLVGTREPLGDLDINIYPNPTQGWVQVAYAAPQMQRETAALCLFNTLGQRVLQSADIHHLDLSMLPAGAYMLQWVDAEGRLLGKKRLMKE